MLQRNMVQEGVLAQRVEPVIIKKNVSAAPMTAARSATTVPAGVGAVRSQPQHSSDNVYKQAEVSNALDAYTPQQNRDEIIGQSLDSRAQSVPQEKKVTPAKQPYEKSTEEEEGKTISDNVPIKFSGEIRLSGGVTSDDFIWKEANADKVGIPHEKNWRYLWGPQKYNTYDEKIYDRLRLGMTSTFKGPFNAGADFTIDPWTFIGTRDVRVYSTTGTDYVDMTLKYWSNTRRTIDEVYRSNTGNIIRLSEIKVIDNKTTPYTPLGLPPPDWGTLYNGIPVGEIDRTYRPLRKLYTDYTKENFKLHVFPISDQYEALTFDDPLRLSNNHVYWEESPWLDTYDPSRTFDRLHDPLKVGRWNRRYSFYTRDSSDDYPHRLTFLRGASFTGELGPFTFDATTATPLYLWGDYEHADSVESAMRLQYPMTEELKFGLLYTNKLGIASKSIEAVNNVWGADASYEFMPYTTLAAEFAGSTLSVDEINGVETSFSGLAGAFGLKFNEPKEISSGFYRGKVFAAYMDKDFYPGLSNYRYTRRDDPFWGRNVVFSDLKPDDEQLIWGDGMDRGRFAVGAGGAVKVLNNKLDTRLDVRNVTNDDGDHIETVTRLESTYAITHGLTSKILAYYQYLPKTTKGVDPLIYTKTIYGLTDYYSDDDSHPLNSDVAADKDPSVGSFGAGLQYDFTPQISAEGIYQRTNDPMDFPRSLLNENFVTDTFSDGVWYDQVVPFLYQQKLFGVPPYKYYNIFKSKITVWAIPEQLKFRLSFTKNENKMATGIDENITHIGFEADYTLNKKWNFWFKYIYSELFDLTSKLQDLSATPAINRDKDYYYNGHNNFFVGLRYTFRKDETLTLLYGEFVGYDDEYLDSNWTLSALDTQHIFRIFYKKEF